MQAGAIAAMLVVVLSGYAIGLYAGIRLAGQITLVPPPGVHEWSYRIFAWLVKLLVVWVVMLVVSALVWIIILPLAAIA